MTDHVRKLALSIVNLTGKEFIQLRREVNRLVGDDGDDGLLGGVREPRRPPPQPLSDVELRDAMKEHRT